MFGPQTHTLERNDGVYVYVSMSAGGQIQHREDVTFGSATHPTDIDKKHKNVVKRGDILKP